MVSHYQILQGGQICFCFYLVAAVDTVALALAGQHLPNKVGQCRVVPHPPSLELCSVICPAPALESWLLALPLVSEIGCVLPLPHQAEVNYRFSVYGVQFFWSGVGEVWGAICSLVAVDYVVPLRAGGMWHSPFGVADSLWQSWVQVSEVYVSCVYLIRVW
jgi:hypothetical protein